MAKKREDADAALAEEMRKGAREAGREKAASTDPHSEEMQRFIDQAVQTPYQQVRIQVHRRSHTKARPQFLGVIDTDVSTFAHHGIMAIVKEYSGGGDYDCTVASEGCESRRVQFSIAGDPLPPAPDRERARQQAMQNQHAPQQSNLSGIFGPGQPGYGQSQPWSPQPPPPSPYGMQGPYGMQPQFPGMTGMPQKPDPTEKMLDMMREIYRESKAPEEDPRLEKIEAQLEEEKRLRREAEERYRQEERDRRRDKELDELRRESERRHEEMMRRMEQNRQPQVNSSVELAKALSPLAQTVLPQMMNRGADTMKTMSGILGSVVDSQKAAADTQARTMEVIMNRPTEEDRMIRVSEAVSNTMSTQVGLVGTVLSQMMQEKGDEGSPWFQLGMKAIDTAGSVGQAMLGGALEEEPDEEEVMQEIEAPASVQRRQLTAAQQAGRQARAGILRRQQEARQAQHQAQQQQVSGMEEPPPAVRQDAVRVDLPSISEFDTAMQTIFTMIAKGGDANEIAFRLWKHAASGNEESGGTVGLARDWFLNPRQGTPLILGNLRARDEIVVSDERIDEITAAIERLYEFLDGGGDPKQFLAQHGLSLRMPKRVRTNFGNRKIESDDPNRPEFGTSDIQIKPIGQIITDPTEKKAAEEGPVEAEEADEPPPAVVDSEATEEEEPEEGEPESVESPQTP